MGMTEQELNDRARNRFVTIQLVRIGATIVVLFALLLWQTDYIAERGSLLSKLGFPLAVVALVTSFLAPKWLARRWRTPPSA
jgi:hypothetical protein